MATTACSRSRDGGGSHAEVVALPHGGFACSRSSLLDAPECHVHDGKPGSAPRALARLSGFSGASEWAECESITTASTDGTPIQSWVTRPKGGAKQKPVLLWIHGGPIGMSGDGWHWRWNALLAVAQGYTVVQPNPRGSTGFGQPFIQGIWGNVWGAQCYRDLMAVTDAPEQRPDVDKTRIMAMGGSFGGYMTNWIGTQTQRFRCLVTHASIVHDGGLHGHHRPPGLVVPGDGRREPVRRPRRLRPLRAHPPHRQVEDARADHPRREGLPLPDRRGLNLFEALQYHGVESELVVFPDENHWILKPRNVVAWYEQVFGFIGRHMRAA